MDGLQLAKKIRGSTINKDHIKTVLISAED